MVRPRTPLSSYGKISTVEVEPGKWRARARYRFPSGKLKQVERFAPSRAKAEAALRSALTTIQESSASEVKRETRMSDLGSKFLESKSSRAPRTIAGYTDIVGRIINPRIGDLAISEVTPERLQRFIDGVADEFGVSSAKNTRSVLSGIMGLAVRNDAIDRNPVRDLAQIEVNRQGAVAVPLDVLPGLLAAVRADQAMKETGLADLVEFIAGTGVRISEAIGLDGSDVTLLSPSGVPTIGAVVTVRKSKTDAGVRTITVPASVAVMLARQPLADGPLFPTPLGKRRDRTNTSAAWADARERLGLGDYSFHSFRKSVATALDQAGLTARDIAEYLGHANPSITMNVYMSRSVGGSRAADALDSLMQVHDK